MVVETNGGVASPLKTSNLEAWKRLKDDISGTPRRIFFKPNGIEAESSTCNSSTCFKRLDDGFRNGRKSLTSYIIGNDKISQMRVRDTKCLKQCFCQCHELACCFNADVSDLSLAGSLPPFFFGLAVSVVFRPKTRNLS